MCGQVNVTVAPGARIDHTPLLGVVSCEAPGPCGPAFVKVSLPIPELPTETSVAGVPCISLI